MNHSELQHKQGLLLGFTAQLVWGFAALYWAQTKPVATEDLLVHRVLWSIPVLIVCVLLLRQLSQLLAVLRSGRALAVLVACALLSATNWGVFLWAVTNGHAAEASMGYFLLPLVSIALGMLVFGESLSLRQVIAVSFAVAAVVVMVAAGQGIPWVALCLSMTFGFYSAIRKAVTVSAVVGLLVETLLMGPVALWWVLEQGGAGFGRYGWKVDVFLCGAGLLTALPLLAYVSATRLMPLSALGLLSYVGPSTQLLVAVLLLDETVNVQQMTAFTLVWIGLLIATAGGLRRRLQR